MHEFIIHTVACSHLQKNETSGNNELKLDILDHYHTNPDRYFEARRAQLDGQKITEITIKDGTVIKAGDADWDKAKQHAPRNGPKQKRVRSGRSEFRARFSAAMTRIGGSAK